MQHTYRLFFAVFLLCGSLGWLHAQQFDFPPDSICLTLDDNSVVELIRPDLPPGVEYRTNVVETECFFVNRLGQLSLSPNATAERCCGPQPGFELEVRTPTSDGSPGDLLGIQFVELTIKCPKPDCGLVDLEELAGDPTDEPGQSPTKCINACEFSTATYLFTQESGLNYNWSVSPMGAGTVNYDPMIPGQLQVSWADITPASLSVAITDGNGDPVRTRTWCVELTPSPVADFTAVTDACLGQEVYFTNTSTGAPATYDWDFGDGNTAQNVTNPSHEYTTAGTYTVTLYATSSGVNPDGSQACCCTDSISYDITIDPLPGPGIFWISTLCEDDASKYWTDATGCDSLIWEVSPNGTITGGQGTDTIMVQWGAGPAGTISLRTVGCDIAYCPYPSEAVVPIISTNGSISGPIEVCKGATASYELPKWVTTEYEWFLPDGGSFNGPNNGHIVSVTWPSTPGTYTLVSEYGSAFLAGLPNHEAPDCYGRAELTVTVLGEFDIFGQNQVCVNQTTTYSAFGDFGGATFDWSIDGFPAFDQAGANNYTVDWSLLPGPGAYLINAVANTPGPGDYCVGEQSFLVLVTEAIAPTISGPDDYCVGEPVVFSVLSPTPGYSYFWSVSPGTVVTGNGGPTVTIEFTSTAGGTVTVIGQMNVAPFCQSEAATKTLSSKEFTANPQITNIPACTNSLATYGLTEAQDAAATYEWSISPETLGSVIADGDTDSPQIQWNNDPGSATITCVITLCGQTLTLTQSITLTAPTVPVISQTGTLCPGGSADLSINGALFASQTWSTGATTASITVTAPGNYVVNTIDLNGCPGVDRFRVLEVDGPAISINTFDRRQYCVDDRPIPPPSVLTATTDAANEIEWFCNGVSQGAAAVGNTTFSHNFDTIPMTFTYVAVATDPNGCTSTSDPIFIRHERCCGDPYVSDPISQIHNFTAVQRSPDCDIYDLVAEYSGDSVVCHAWDLPFETQILASGGASDPNRDSLTIRLPGVGCFDVDSEIFVYSYKTETVTVIDANGNPQQVTVIDTIKCGREVSLKLCNPLLADFEFFEECDKVTFTEDASVDFSLTAGPVTYSWDFGDGSPPVTGPMVMHNYATNGSYTVTLTVSDGVCQSQSVQTVNISNLPDSDFTFSPSVVCYGEPATFTGTGTSVISWFWDFGDGATFSGNGPQKTWLPASAPANYTVTLYTENSAGCLDTVTQVITVNPAPDDDVIAASNGLIICEGSSTDLSVLPQAGATYAWSTGATTNAITVSTAGTYDVTITTADGCERVIDAVEVQLVPLPDISWSGNPFICDFGGTTLTSLAGGGHSYSWTDVTTGATGSGMTFTVNYDASAPVHDIILQVTNIAYGCVAETTIQVEQAVSPAPILGVTGGLCEGDGSLIEVTNVEPDVVYSWNTGETGPSIFTYQAGVYTVVATNVITGCTGTDEVTIHPLPDICLVPTGCYETCAPDTLHAPLGDYSYAWFQNGAFVGNGSELIVNMSASYAVVVIDNVTGCTSISDSLYLEVIDCDSTDCDKLVTRATAYDKDNPAGNCCYELFYDGLPDGVYAIEISTADAEINPVPGSQNPFFGYVGTPDASTIQLAADGALSSPLPSGMTGPGMIAFCPANPTSEPQTIVIDYLDADLMVVCSDTIRTECKLEPNCIYVASDTLYCGEDGGLILDMTVCVPLDAEYPIGFLQVLPIGLPAGITLTLEETFSPAIMPGECRNISFTLPELTPGGKFCYTLVGHLDDPGDDPSALCCSNQIEYCLEVPDCDPCDNLFVEGVVPTGDEGDCCYDIFLFDGSPDFDFDGIDLCIIGGDASLNVYASLGDPLIGTVNAAGTSASIVSATGGLLPDGLFQLPRICLENGTSANNTIEIKWMSGGEIVCRDTITVFCEPPCGFLKGEFECEGDAYVFNGSIINTSDFVMNEAHVIFDPSLGLDAYNTTITFTSPLNPGDDTNFSLSVGPPAGPGDTICFSVILHELLDDENHLNCCQIDTCFVMPDCEIDKCNCDLEDELTANINLGFDTVRIGPGPLDYRFVPRGQFSSCDEFQWRVRRRNPNGPWMPAGTDIGQAYSFPDPGLYQVEMRVNRVGPDGVACGGRAVRNIRLSGPDSVGDGNPEVNLFPNPATTELFVTVPHDERTGLVSRLDVFGANGNRIMTQPLAPMGKGESQTVRLDIGHLPAGLYLLTGQGTKGNWTKRFIKR